MFDQSGHGARAGGGAGKHGRPAPDVARVPVRARALNSGAFVLGGNANTLAFVTSFRAENDVVNVQLVPLAQTPLGTVAGQTWQKAGVALSSLLDWIDSTFNPDDERAFLAPVRDIELLARIEWHVDPPEVLDEAHILNIDDVPADVADALAHPAEPLVQCAACRRLCVRGHFALRERELCAWDFHRQLFGKRGPWRSGAYDARYFESLPQPAYVAPPLLDELGAEVIAAFAGVADEAAQRAINIVIEAEPDRAHMAVRTSDGYTVLRER